MTKSDTTTKLFAALTKAQGEFKPVGFDAQNAFLKNKYATLGAIIEAHRSTLAKHGLSIVQMPINEGEQIGIETVLAHESGEWLANRFVMAIGEEKGKSAAQVAGSILTYLRRYSLGAFLNAYADEDNDGNAHGSPINAPATPKPQTPAQPAKAAPAATQTATPAQREKMLKNLSAAGFDCMDVLEYARKAGIVTAEQDRKSTRLNSSHT